MDRASCRLGQSLPRAGIRGRRSENRRVLRWCLLPSCLLAGLLLLRLTLWSWSCVYRRPWSPGRISLCPWCSCGEYGSMALPASGCMRSKATLPPSSDTIHEAWPMPSLTAWPIIRSTDFLQMQSFRSSGKGRNHRQSLAFSLHWCRNTWDKHQIGWPSSSGTDLWPSLVFYTWSSWSQEDSSFPSSLAWYLSGQFHPRTLAVLRIYQKLFSISTCHILLFLSLIFSHWHNISTEQLVGIHHR